MEKVYLSDSGPKVSEVIYGFWRWVNYGNDTTIQMEKIVNLCLELGINTFDHADIYGDYKIEGHFGKLFKTGSVKREDVILFGKCGIRKSAKGLTYYDTSSEHIYKSVDNSLRNLHTDYLDVFMVHHADHLSSLEDTAKALAYLVSTGKVNRIGVANYSVFQHQQLSYFLPFNLVTNHIELNLHNVTAIKDGRIDFLKQHFCKPLAWAPLAGGKIENGLDAKSELIRLKLNEIATKYNANIEQIAVSWLLKLGTLPIVGSLEIERIKNAATATHVNLSNEDWYELYHVAQT